MESSNKSLTHAAPNAPNAIQLSNMVKNYYASRLAQEDKKNLLKKKPDISIDALVIITTVYPMSEKAKASGITSQRFGALILLQSEQQMEETVYLNNPILEVPLTGSKVISALTDSKLIPIPNLKCYEMDNSNQSQKDWKPMDYSLLKRFKDEDYGKTVHVKQLVETGSILIVSNQQLEALEAIKAHGLGKVYKLTGLNIGVSYNEKNNLDDRRSLWPQATMITNTNIAAGSLIDLFRKLHYENSPLSRVVIDPQLNEPIPQSPHFLFHVGPSEIVNRMKETTSQRQALVYLQPPDKPEEFLGTKTIDPQKKLPLVGFQGLPKTKYDTQLDPQKLDYWYHIIDLFPLGFESTIRGSLHIYNNLVWKTFAYTLLYNASYVLLCHINPSTYKLQANDNAFRVANKSTHAIYEMVIDLLLIDLPMRIETIGFNVSADFAHTYITSVPIKDKEIVPLNLADSFFVLADYSSIDLKTLRTLEQLEYYVIVDIPFGQTQLEDKKKITSEEIEIFVESINNSDNWALIFSQHPSLKVLFSSVVKLNYITVAINRTVQKDFSEILKKQVK